ncbi:hypothetical protein AB0H28_28610 [Micromonospora sp. NPDC050980]|uniref:hypothetical protein n=1 Tax=Micromonospora sp. NPDC050980 TaxID=3155161 RepID=UPI003405ACF9
MALSAARLEQVATTEAVRDYRRFHASAVRPHRLSGCAYRITSILLYHMTHVGELGGRLAPSTRGGCHENHRAASPAGRGVRSTEIGGVRLWLAVFGLIAIIVGVQGLFIPDG